MRSEPRWLTAQTVVELNEDCVAPTGEPFLVRDRNLLESACANPVNRWHYTGEGDILALGVALMLAIARNHPFEQGNKRTAYAALGVFLDANGYALIAPDENWTADLLVSALEGRADEGVLIAALSPHVA